MKGGRETTRRHREGIELGNQESNSVEEGEPRREAQVEKPKGRLALIANRANSAGRAAQESASSLTQSASLLSLFDKAFAGSGVIADKQVKNLREKNPNKSTVELVSKLERRFLSEVTAIGAATGGTAAVPGVGTVAALGTAVGDTTAFMGLTAVHVQSVARLLEVDVADSDHERALVLAVLLGGSSSGAVSKAAERTGAHWGKLATKKVPTSSIKQLNKVLGRNFVTKYGSKQGILVIGKIAPFGFGAAIGTGGNHLFGRGAVKATRITFADVLKEMKTVSADVHEFLEAEVLDEQRHKED